MRRIEKLLRYGTVTPLLGAAFRDALALRRLLPSYASQAHGTYPLGRVTTELSATEEAAAPTDAPAFARLP